MHNSTETLSASVSRVRSRDLTLTKAKCVPARQWKNSSTNVGIPRQLYRPTHDLRSIGCKRKGCMGDQESARHRSRVLLLAPR